MKRKTPQPAAAVPVAPFQGHAGLCQLCGIPRAGPGGICPSCAGSSRLSRTCICGTIYSTSDAACQGCMSKMLAQLQAVQQQAAAQAMLGPGAVTQFGPAAVHFPRRPPPEPLPRADMQVVDLICWRVWRITSLGYLRSLTAEAIWLPGVPMEAVEVHDQLADARGPTGIHVFKQRHGAVLEVENYVANGREINPSYAIGSVLLWGDVVEHERGYRAERAKILSIDDVTWRGKPPWDKETAEVLAFLRARYGVAVPRGTTDGDRG